MSRNVNQSLKYSIEMSEPIHSNGDTMPAVVNSDDSQQTDSRASILPKSNPSSGQIDVIMDVQDKWSPPITPVDRQNMYWRNTIATVMSPFMLTGAPVLSSVLIADNSDDIDSTFKWLKSLFTNTKILPLNALTITITTALNSWLLYLTLEIIYYLFILGEVPKNFAETLLEFSEIVPIILAVDLFWFKGHLLRDVILQFDSVDIVSQQKISINITIELLIIYILCFSVYIINYFTFQWRLKFGFTAETSEEYFEHLPHRVVNTLLIPVYISFCCVSITYFN